MLYADGLASAAVVAAAALKYALCDCADRSWRGSPGAPVVATHHSGFQALERCSAGCTEAAIAAVPPATGLSGCKA